MDLYYEKEIEINEMHQRTRDYFNVTLIWSMYESSLSNISHGKDYLQFQVSTVNKAKCRFKTVHSHFWSIYCYI